MQSTLLTTHIFGWVAALTIILVGILNLILIHPVPAVAYLLLSLVYLPPVNNMLRNRVGFGIPAVAKVMLGIVIVMFTLGVSDLGDMVD